MQRRPEYELNQLLLPRKVKVFDEKLGEHLGLEKLTDLSTANVSEK